MQIALKKAFIWIVFFFLQKCITLSLPRWSPCCYNTEKLSTFQFHLLNRLLIFSLITFGCSFKILDIDNGIKQSFLRAYCFQWCDIAFGTIVKFN